jgi:hypothetical protein
MIISDLNHFEVITEPNKVVGGLNFALSDYLNTGLSDFTADFLNDISSRFSKYGDSVSSLETSSQSFLSEDNNRVSISISTQGGGQASSFAKANDLIATSP